jgi:hypothetical protein
LTQIECEEAKDAFWFNFFDKDKRSGDSALRVLPRRLLQEGVERNAPAIESLPVM